MGDRYEDKTSSLPRLAGSDGDGVGVAELLSELCWHAVEELALMSSVLGNGREAVTWWLWVLLMGAGQPQTELCGDIQAGGPLSCQLSGKYSDLHSTVAGISGCRQVSMFSGLPCDSGLEQKFIPVELCATFSLGCGGIDSGARTLVWGMAASQGEGMLYLEPGPPSLLPQRALRLTQ